MSPTQFLILVLGVTVIAACAEAIRTHCRCGDLSNLARKWGMHFARGDRLRLADRIAPKLPIIGSANVRVRDLLFCTDGHLHRYLFTVEYGLGVVRGKRRKFRVAGFQEPVARGGSAGAACHECILTLAPEELEICPAYEFVRDALMGNSAPARSAQTDT